MPIRYSDTQEVSQINKFVNGKRMRLYVDHDSNYSADPIINIDIPL